MENTKKQKVLIAGLSALVLGAGSYFLLAGASAEPKDRDAVAQVPTVKVRTPAPKVEKVIRRPKPDKPESPPRIHREPNRQPRPAPIKHREPGRRTPKPPEKRRYPAG